MGAAPSAQAVPVTHLLVQAALAHPAHAKPVVDDGAASHGVAPTEFLALPLDEPLRKVRARGRGNIAPRTDGGTRH